MTEFKPGDRVVHRIGRVGTVTQNVVSGMHRVKFDGDLGALQCSPDNLTRVTPPSPKTGDRVRVVMEGTLADGAGDNFIIREDRLRQYFRLGAVHVVSVEILEPEWQKGDIVATPSGSVYARGESYYWRHCLTGQRIADAIIVRPLTLLVRDGKAVSA